MKQKKENKKIAVRLKAIIPLTAAMTLLTGSACPALYRKAAGGRVIGDVVALSDVAGKTADFYRTALLPGVVAVIAGLAVLVLFRFILKRVEAKTRQAESREKLLKTIIENSPTAILLINEDREIEEANSAAESILGRKREEIIGHICHNHICPTECDQCPILDKGETVNLSERTALNANGESIPILKSVSKIKIEGKRYLLENFLDIREQKQARQALLDSLERNELLLASIFSILIATDSNHKIIQWNPAAEEAFSIPAPQAIGRPFTITGKCWNLDMISGVVANCARERLPSNVENVSFRSADGTEKHLDVTINPVKGGSDEERFGFLLIARDVTARKRMEEQMIHSDKMASIGQLAAGVAHEINNPTGFVASNLNTMAEYNADLKELLGECRNLLDVCAKQDTPVGELAGKVNEIWRQNNIDEIVDDLQIIVEESIEGVGRIKKIVSELKDFSRSDAPEFERIDINQMIDKVLTIAWNEIRYKAEVIKEYSDLPKVECQAGQISQAMLNILVNAAHAIKERGTITIQTYVKDAGEDQKVFVVISDTGQGIPLDIQSRIFDPFFTTKSFGKGTGLGLSITHNIIQRHGGSILVASQAGEGTTFTICLPVVQNTDEAEKDENVLIGAK